MDESVLLDDGPKARAVGILVLWGLLLGVFRLPKRKLAVGAMKGELGVSRPRKLVVEIDDGKLVGSVDAVDGVGGRHGGTEVEEGDEREKDDRWS